MLFFCIYQLSFMKKMFSKTTNFQLKYVSNIDIEVVFSHFDHFDSFLVTFLTKLSLNQRDAFKIQLKETVI